jgi:hypothetical protein
MFSGQLRVLRPLLVLSVLVYTHSAVIGMVARWKSVSR